MDSIELKHILVSVLLLSLALSIKWGGYSFPSVILSMPIILIAVGSGFILHELAHKFVAQHYGAYATYRAWPLGLMIMMFLAILPGGIIFAAPGAVYIFERYYGQITRKQNGIISLAGPATNILLAILFLMLAFFSLPLSFLLPVGFLVQIGTMGFSVNIFLAFFNMIPFPPLDGSKVLSWDWRIWLAAFLPLLLLVFFRFAF